MDKIPMKIRVKRVYEPVEKNDGIRILIDRLWPRGISKKEAGIDLWMKEIAPSTVLRQWFNHDPAKWQLFKIRYFKEIANNSWQTKQIENMQHKNITFLYSAKDEKHNNAVVLKEYFTLQRQ